jgi:hypothetical protein
MSCTHSGGTSSDGGRRGNTELLLSRILVVPLQYRYLYRLMVDEGSIFSLAEGVLSVCHAEEDTHTV